MSTNPGFPKIEFGSLSDRGVKRSENQDTCGAFPSDSLDSTNPKGRLFIIADGMGGHTGGQEASKMAVHYISEVYYSDPGESIKENLKSAYRTANLKIYQRAAELGTYDRMGTTCSALVITGNRAFIAHVGDSKIYRIRGNQIDQITQDHTHVGELARHGILTEKEAKENPSRSVLTRALGAEETVEVDFIEDKPVPPGTFYLLCSDGLVNVSKKEMAEIVESNSPQVACNKLIELENSRGGDDNVTVQIVRIGPRDMKDSRQTPLHRITKWNKQLAYVAVVMLVVFLALVISRNQINKRSPGIVEGNRLLEGDSMASLGASDTGKNVVFEEVFPGDSSTSETNKNADLNENQEIFVAEDKAEFIDKENTVASETGFQTAALGRDLEPERNSFEPDTQDVRTAKKLQPGETPAAMEKQEITENRTELVLENAEGVLENSEPDSTQNDSIDVNFFNPAWQFSNLSSEDYVIINERDLILLESNKIKKVIYPVKHTDTTVEVEVENADRLADGRFGLILGHQTFGKYKIEEFYLASIDNKGLLVINRVAQHKKFLLAQQALQWGSLVKDGVLRFRFTCLGDRLFVFINEQLQLSLLERDIINGGIGLYTSQKLRVKFSNFKVSSALAITNKELKGGY